MFRSPRRVKVNMGHSGIRNHKMKILLLDIVPPVSLAMARSLGRSGYVVAGTSHLPAVQPCERSRYMDGVYKTCDPHEEAAFLGCVQEILLKEKFDFIVPLSEPTLKAVSDGKDSINPLSNFLIPTKESSEIVLSKKRTLDFVKKLGIRIPNGIYPESLREVEAFAKARKEYPVVIKGVKGGHLKRISYARSAAELVSKYKSMIEIVSLKGQNEWPVIQEYIKGKGVGYFGLFDKGVERAYFMHERIWQFPLTGGPSSIAKSIYDGKLRELGQYLLNTLKWNGLAMVEFKRGASDELVFMEINPRPWGSMDLPIYLGIDFPTWCVELGCGIRNNFQNQYPLGKKFIWLVPNCLLNVCASPRSLPYLLKYLIAEGSKTDIEINDLYPILSQLRLFLYYIKTSIKEKKSIRFPQGKIEQGS